MHYLFFILFGQLIQFSFLYLPLWNLKESSIDLLTESKTTYTVYDQTKEYDSQYFNLKIVKELSRNIDNNQIEEKNIINLNGYTTETNWEDIESFYIIDKKYYYICPKGKNFLTIFDTSKKTFKEITMDVDGDDWDLLCYKQPDISMLFIAYLNSHNKNKLYAYDLEEKKLLI